MTDIVLQDPTVPSPDDVAYRLTEDEIELVNLQCVDITGTLRSITIPASQVPLVVERGKWFDGSAIDAFARTAESDMYLFPDLTTYAVIPWKQGEQRTARLICWIRTPDGESFAGDPRAALSQMVEAARNQGYRFSTAVEVEFFLLPGGELKRPTGNTGYFGVSDDPEEQVVEETVLALRRMGTLAVSHHHEVATHQHEVDFEADDALRVADNMMTLKYVLRSIAPRHGLRVSFMPKPWQGVNGSGMHVHQCVSRVGEVEGNVPGDEYGLSEVTHAFLAGQLQHGRGMCAVMAPLVNSYKRFVDGHEAPIHLSWARHNRNAFIRVPQLADADAGGAIEIRAPDPSCNPYLAFSVMLACGLDGVRHGMTLLPPVEETIYGYDREVLRRQSVGVMPVSLGEALTAMEDDVTVQDALGEYLSARFLELKTLEWRAYLEHVGDWELEHYLDQA